MKIDTPSFLNAFCRWAPLSPAKAYATNNNYVKEGRQFIVINNNNKIQ